MSHQVGASHVPQVDTGANLVAVLGLRLLSKLTATCWVLTDLGGRVGSQRVVRVKPAMFIRLKQTKIWLFEWKALRWSGVPENKGPCVDPHGSVCRRLCQDPEYSRAGPLGFGRTGMYVSCKG